jgi:hypothetical protein
LWLTASLALALIFIFAGYIVTSGTLRITAQLTGVNLGLGALVLQLATGVGWATRGFRSVRERQRLLVAALAEVLERGQVGSPTIALAVQGSATTPTHVVVQRGTVHHLSTCPLAADKAIVLVGEQASTGREACRVCQP